MRAVVQRVSSASVLVDGEPAGSIQHGLLCLVGVCSSDAPHDANWMADRICGLRVFEDALGKLNLNIVQVGGSLLLVPNFTVCADTSKGTRPSFDAAAPFEVGKKLFGELVTLCGDKVAHVESGTFGADMKVHLINDGPVTVVLESKSKAHGH
ncbi:MAG: D-tyrosyl-tRNA(Tyr) deacylase [Fimbriimonadales bacterium]|nr:D-tyrosyl-tRNA(Tyr) deacylase [Fimbriimonadales bacterium]